MESVDVIMELSIKIERIICLLKQIIGKEKYKPIFMEKELLTLISRPR